ncbi:MAG: hypothetical protein V4590_08930 [Bacteroidota bacterium]
MSPSKRNGYLLLVLLLLISLGKDYITPDYLNTPSAVCLNPNHPSYLPIGASHLTYPWFWIHAYLYSLLFIIIPACIIYNFSSKDLLKPALYLFAGVFVFEYLLLFSQQTIAVKHILPKINRYFHSPLITLFLLAAFTLYNQYDKQSDK